MKFISCRRFYIEKQLKLFFKNLCGNVLDVGGKKYNKRGNFSHLDYDKVNLTFLNIDYSTDPDILSTAENIPSKDNIYDAALIIELLEHVENPREVLKETYRVIKKDGIALVTMPFMYPVHADPNDFQRWTKSKMENEIILAGFKIEKIEPMGGTISVFFDSLRFQLANKKNINNLHIRLANYLIRFFSKLVVRYENDNFFVTTGWVAIVSK